MKTFLKENKIFLLLYLLFFICGAAIIGWFEKGDEILYFNTLHNSFFDQFFRWTSFLAEAPAFLLIFLLILFSSYGHGILLGLNLILNAVVVQFLKLAVFPNQIRPAVFFEGKTPLNFVPGVEIFHQHSFPSGHTTIAFAVFFMLSLFAQDKKWSVVFFFSALLIGIARVYLLEHFFRDVYAGSLLAMAITTVFWLTFAQSDFYRNLKWKDKALLK